MALNGAAWALKSIVGDETFDQIQQLANDGTFAKIVAFAENGEALTNLVSNLKETLERLEQKFDDFAKSFEDPVELTEAGKALVTEQANEPVRIQEPGSEATLNLDGVRPAGEQSKSLAPVNSGERSDEPGGEPALHGSGVPGDDATSGQPGNGEPSTGAADSGGISDRNETSAARDEFGIGGF